MTGATLQELAERMLRAKHVAIAGHIHPDGDCLGSVLGLAGMLRELGKEVDTLLSNNQRPELYAFLPAYDGLQFAFEYTGTPDLFVALDTPTPERLADSYVHLKAAPDSLVLDHHPDTQPYAALWTSSPESAATGELIWALSEHLGAARTPELATCCFTALVTDTGRFQYQNTTPESFRLAGEMVACGADSAKICEKVYQSRRMASVKLDALAISRLTLVGDGAVAYTWITNEDMDEYGAIKDDTEQIIDLVRSVRGPKAVALIRVDGDTVRFSMRSKGEANVGEVARALGGGGHDAAAGATLSPCTFDEAVAALVPKLLAAAGAAS